MSLCVLIQNENQIYMSADSRMSVFAENGKQYRLSDMYRKIDRVGNMVIFKSGNAYFCNQVVGKYAQRDKHDIDSFRNIVISQFEKFKKEHSDIVNGHQKREDLVCAFTIGTIENGNTVVYAISEKNNFELIKFDKIANEDSDRNTFLIGCDLDEISKKFNELDFSNLEDEQLIFNNYKEIYNNAANEAIGGVLFFYSITKNGINYYEEKIADSKVINDYKDYKGLHGHFQAQDFRLLDGTSFKSALTENKSQINGDYVDHLDVGRLTAKTAKIEDALIGSLNVNKLIGNEIVGKTLKTNNNDTYVYMQDQSFSLFQNNLEKLHIGFNDSIFGPNSVGISIGGGDASGLEKGYMAKRYIDYATNPSLPANMRNQFCIGYLYNDTEASNQEIMFSGQGISVDGNTTFNQDVTLRTGTNLYLNGVNVHGLTGIPAVFA